MASEFESGHPSDRNRNSQSTHHQDSRNNRSFLVFPWVIHGEKCRVQDR